MSLCQYTSDTGTKCTGSVSKNGGGVYCKKHRNTVSLNDECPVCCEKGPMYPLSCPHKMHLDCMRGMVEDTCPICRSKILNLPIFIREQIRKNRKQHQHEREEEDMREAQSYYDQQAAKISPQVQILLALAYLRDLGIPYERIPNVELILDPRIPYPCRGSIFSMVVSNVYRLLTQEVTVDGVIEEHNQMYEDAENYPFDPNACPIRTISVRPDTDSDQNDQSMFWGMDIDLSIAPPVDDELLLELTS